MLLSGDKASNIPSLSYLRGILTLQPYVIIQFAGTLIVFPFHRILYWSIILIHYTDLTLWARCSNYSRFIGETFTCQGVWNKSGKKFRGLLPGDISVCGTWRVSLLKWRVRSFIWPLLQPKRDTCLVGLFGLWRLYIPLVGVLLWTIYLLTQKAASFDWVPEQGKALQQVQFAKQGALPLGPYDQHLQWCLKCHLSKMLFGAFERFLLASHSPDP